MPTSLDHIHSDTPMGANLIADGATFRVWAPHAHRCMSSAISIIVSATTRACSTATIAAIGGVSSPVYATGSATCSMLWGRRRGPEARPLRPRAANAVSQRMHHSENRFPLARNGYVTPQFHNFVIYQLHVGAFFTPNLPKKGGTFLDVARKIPHIAGLGVSAIQLMPIQEFQTQYSLGYNGTDYFSPEMDFAVEDATSALRAACERAARCQGLATLSVSKTCAAR